MSSSKSIHTMYSSSQISLRAHNGSLKSSQASPMFPSSSNVKKKTSLESHEPSSPKVTCIGQVRVMTKKKQARKNRTAARSKSCRRNVSYRKMDSSAAAQGGSLEILNYPFQQQQDGFSDRNQRWVHFPATICRAFGGEFNCFLPCKSSSTANETEKMDGSGGEKEKIEEDARISHRRHAFEGLDIENFVKESSKSDSVITTPVPKNALLLMRCRFDPVKMGALAQQNGDFDGESDGNKLEKKRVSFKIDNYSPEEKKVEIFMEHKAENLGSYENSIEELVSDSIKEDDFCIGVTEYVALEEDGKDISDKAVIQTEQFEEEIGDVSNADVVFDPENELENEFNEVLVLPKNELGGEVCVELIMREEVDLEAENESDVLVEERKLEKKRVLEEIGVGTVAVAVAEDEIPESSEEEVESVETRHERFEPDIDQKTLEAETKSGSKQREDSSKQNINITDSFSRDHHNHEPKKRTSIDSKPNNNLHFQPPRSFCSFPAAPSSNLVPCGGSKVCELSVLPRCKSEPRRSATKLAPEACFWKLEPHRPAATMGVRAAGLGF